MKAFAESRPRLPPHRPAVLARWLLFWPLLLPVANPAVALAQATGAQRHLLLDSRVIESLENARLTVGTVKKHPANPLFGEDRAWEKRFDNLYANVIYDEKAGLYQCWYSPFIVDASAKGMRVEDRAAQRYRPPPDREMAICYATSHDGLVWTKPEMGLVEYQGSKANNILWRGQGPVGQKPRQGPHGAGIFRDANDPNPARQYKAFLKRDTLSVAFSADGIHWDPALSRPAADSAGDTHNNAFWAPTLGKYVGITRQWNPRLGRQVAMTSSEDFLHWSTCEVVLEGLSKNEQTYAMPVFFHAGVYLGLLAIHQQSSDRVWTELTWSPDARTWHRISAGTPLIGNDGREGDYDWGCVYAAAVPVNARDGIRIYYGGSDGKHTSWRNGFFCLATLRPDGWAGFEQVVPDKPALLTTRALAWPGRTIRVTADVSSGGSVRVSVIDPAGLELARAKTINETGTDAALEWDRTIAAGSIRLRFEAIRAKVYSFSLE